MSGEKERKVKDFFEEFERLKKLKNSTAPSARPPLPQPPARNISVQGSASACSAPVQGGAPLRELISALKELGLDAKPLEALMEYSKTLEDREKQLVEEIEKKQHELALVRAARDILKKLGA